MGARITSKGKLLNIMSTYVMLAFRFARASAGALVVAIFASAFVILALATHLTGIAIRALVIGREMAETALDSAESAGSAEPASPQPAITFDSPELVLA